MFSCCNPYIGSFLILLISFPPVEGNNERNNIDAKDVRNQRRGNDEALTRLFSGLKVRAKNKTNSMLIACWYQWTEGVPEEQVRAGTMDLRKRVTVDVLLPGPTNLEQITASIKSPRKIEIKFKPPGAYLTSRRTAVKSGALSGLGLAGATRVQQEIIIQMMHATSHTQGHERALREGIREEQKELTFEIEFPFDVDMFFCNRDDWGNGPSPLNPHSGGDPISIGMYRCTDVNMQNNNQMVWILHLELTETWRPEYLAEPASPAGYANYSKYA